MLLIRILEEHPVSALTSDWMEFSCRAYQASRFERRKLYSFNHDCIDGQPSFRVAAAVYYQMSREFAAVETRPHDPDEVVIAVDGRLYGHTEVV
jgi:hypothetical protein